MQPDILCDDRLPGCGDFITPEQQILLEPLDDIWKTCMTTNENWGYHPDPSASASSRPGKPCLSGAKADAHV
jgi:alpha-L-fucosidase